MTQLINRESVNEIGTLASYPVKLLELAINQGADMDKLEKLMALQERWDSNQAKKSFTDAMVNFQEKCPVIKKLKQAHNYLYAPLSDIVQQIRKPLSECGLSYRFEQKQIDADMEITCHITHRDGHSEKTSMRGGMDSSGSKNVIQSYGSTATYLQRYTLTGALGITTADDDIDGRLESDVNYDELAKKWEGYSQKIIAHQDCVRDNFDEVVEIKTLIANGDEVEAKRLYVDLGQDIQELLWVAPKNGGIFTTGERAALKSPKQD
jgi:hypothetical protein